MLKDITPKTVKVQQGFDVVLVKEGRTYNFPTYDVTQFCGSRPNGKVIYSVTVFTTKNGKTVVGKAISLSCFS